jgi:hypothetical protein
MDGIQIHSSTVLAAGRRAGLLEVTARNPTNQGRRVPLRIDLGGRLQRSPEWGFQQPDGGENTTCTLVNRTVLLRFQNMALAIRAVTDRITWDTTGLCGRMDLPLAPGEQAALHLAFALGNVEEAMADVRALTADPQAAIRKAQEQHAGQVRLMFEKLPRLEASHPDLEAWYRRSLVHFLTNCWDVPEFVLHPYYSTGSVQGGCLCCYLWNYGETWEIMPLYDPAAHREHIKQFLRNDMSVHFAFDPVSGKAFGPWYPVNQEKLIGLIYYYVKNTGDRAFLKEEVKGKTILEHALAQACCRDDVTKPVALVDYGPSNSHLELRRGYPYNHVMPDLNGRRYANYLMAARLSEFMGKPAPQLRGRAAELKKQLKAKLWNPEKQWFDFLTPRGRDLRWTNQMFKLFGSGVLDTEMEKGLLSHLQEGEFLSSFGLHSLARHDVAYDPADIDNGGPGSCTSFPPQIAERLYKAGQVKMAEDLVRRTLWWGRCLPYWPDSMVADKKDYRKDTPLQCLVDGVAAAQCVIFGMFGIEARFEGGIVISPQPPPFSPCLVLRGVKLRGEVFDVRVEDRQFEVRSGGQTLKAPVGKALFLKEGKLTVVDSRPANQL